MLARQRRACGGKRAWMRAHVALARILRRGEAAARHAHLVVLGEGGVEGYVNVDVQAGKRVHRYLRLVEQLLAPGHVARLELEPANLRLAERHRLLVRRHLVQERGDEVAGSLSGEEARDSSYELRERQQIHLGLKMPDEVLVELRKLTAICALLPRVRHKVCDRERELMPQLAVVELLHPRVFIRHVRVRLALRAEKGRDLSRDRSHLDRALGAARAQLRTMDAGARCTLHSREVCLESSVDSQVGVGAAGHGWAAG